MIALWALGIGKGDEVITSPTSFVATIGAIIHVGAKPVFVDVKLNNLSIDLDQVENILKKDPEVGTIFITALLGISPDIDKLNYLKIKYKVRIMLDSCESTFTKFRGRNIASFFTSTTSTYFGHMLQSVEGGFVFTNDEKEYELFNMIRNHGMYRHLPPENQEKYKNPEVDPLFDFYCIGNNFRNSDIHAYIGLLDFKRVPLYTFHRKFCGEIFTSLLDQNSFYTVQVKNEDNLFSLPIIAKNKETIDKIKNFCKSKGIEYRPIIGGNLLKQTAFKKYVNGDYPNADIINENGLYVGLHYSVTPEQISWFVNTINNI